MIDSNPLEHTDFEIETGELRWDPDLSPRVGGLNRQGWEDDHNEAESTPPSRRFARPERASGCWAPAVILPRCCAIWRSPSPRGATGVMCLEFRAVSLLEIGR